MIEVIGTSTFALSKTLIWVLSASNDLCQLAVPCVAVT